MESAALADWRYTPEGAHEIREHVEEHPDHESYHCLFALHRKARRAYAAIPPDKKASVLAAALTHTQFLNDWGVLDTTECNDGEAALATIELGSAALPVLRPILEDARPAPLFGSEEATLSSMHRYRRKDFACRAIARILGLPFRFSGDPEERDRMIEEIKTHLP
jgi:hypothetical protein